MVGESGFEPPTPGPEPSQYKLQVLYLVSLRGQQTTLSLAQLYRSCTEKFSLDELRREWDSIIAVTATCGDAYTFTIIPCVYAGYKHIRTQAEVSTVYAIPRSPTKNGITGISRQGLRL
jgi:hypothetical protein